MSRKFFRKDGSIIWISPENCRAVRNAEGKLLYYEEHGRGYHLSAASAGGAAQLGIHCTIPWVETMPQNVFRKDLQGRFTFANQQYCRHFALPIEDILGKSDFDFFPRELAEQYQKDDQAVMETGQSREITEQHHPFGQEKTTIQVVKTPLHDHAGKIIGLQGIFWDITEKKRAEEQIRRTTAELARSREELRTKNLLMEENLRMAGEIQLAMLPQQYPNFPQTATAGQSAFQFAHRYQHARGVSGDFSTSPPFRIMKPGCSSAT